MAHITFITGVGRIETEASAGETLLEIARRANVDIDAPCSGAGGCGKCRVKVLDGATAGDRTRHITDGEYKEGLRLACATRPTGDATVLVPSGAYRDKLRTADRFGSDVRRDAEAAGLPFGTGLKKIDVKVDVPTPEDNMPDNERVAEAVCAKTGCASVTFCYRALRSLARTLRESGFDVKCVVETAGETARILDVLPRDDARPVAGVAIDLGTTSVTAMLVDLETGNILARASAGNAQIRYGADVINRIIESCRDGGSERLRSAAMDETGLPLVGRLCREAGISEDDLYRVCVAGNTTMNHLLLGLYTEPVRTEPYVPTFFRPDDLRASEVGFKCHPEARLIVAPNVGSYVGGDITAGCFASMLWDKDELSLLVDLGTNGELVLGNSEFLMCCACSAGPAFEGGDISCGMRATDGAIDSVKIDPATLEPAFTTIGDADAVGLCGSGVIDLIAGLFRAKAIDRRGRFVREHARIRRDEHGIGSYAVAEGIALTEVDIDNFIRAKGAIFSATMTMLRALDMDPSMLDRVYVAGGIGSGIDMDNAVAIGMLPDIDRDRFKFVGNTSLAGAYAMLASDKARDKVDALARSMTYLELSTEPGYMDAFVAACFLPHTDESLFPSATAGIQ